MYLSRSQFYSYFPGTSAFKYDAYLHRFLGVCMGRQQFSWVPPVLAEEGLRPSSRRRLYQAGLVAELFNHF